MSARSSSSEAPSAAVRTMNPPCPFSRSLVNDALQPLALFLGSDLARHADVIHRRHVDQETARQRDVAGDARALLADRLLGDLYQDLLAFFQQVGDQRTCSRLVAAEAASAPPPRRPPRAAAVEPGRGARWVYAAVPAGARTSTAPPVSVATGFGFQQSFGFRLGFIQFRFVLPLLRSTFFFAAATSISSRHRFHGERLLSPVRVLRRGGDVPPAAGICISLRRREFPLRVPRRLHLPRVPRRSQPGPPLPLRSLLPPLCPRRGGRGQPQRPARLPSALRPVAVGLVVLLPLRSPPTRQPRSSGAGATVRVPALDSRPSRSEAPAGTASCALKLRCQRESRTRGVHDQASQRSAHPRGKPRQSGAGWS